MIRFSLIGLIASIIMSCSEKSNDTLVDPFNRAERQCQLMIRNIQLAKDSQADTSLVSPRSLNDGKLVLVTSRDWTSGFFPGELWYLYDHTRDTVWKNQAIRFTSRLQKEQWNGKTHDMGFKMYCSYGNGYRLTQDTSYQNIIIRSARTLATRFKPNAGIIRSWDHHRERWECPVIIDNMMNLELLFEAFKLCGDSSLYKIAVSHAKMTMKNHYRPDMSSYHVVDYDTITGEVLKRETYQGYSDESAWSRGQAWGLYGFTMCYRETRDTVFLNQARKIAQYLLHHPRLPEDMIPYWDFDAPDIPNEPRDASAAAIMASSLYELSEYDSQHHYREKADKILSSLIANYMSSPGENKGFLLTHATGSKPSNSEVEVPLAYADYYFLEALIRKDRLDDR